MSEIGGSIFVLILTWGLIWLLYLYEKMLRGSYSPRSFGKKNEAYLNKLLEEIDERKEEGRR